MATREEIVRQAQGWIGKSEKDGSFKIIIDTYNAYKPLARGYKVKYTDEWCATFVSAVSIACKATGIIPTECGCEKMTELFKKLGAWVEADNYVPSAGDIIFYHWKDTGAGDTTGRANHVGIVEKVANGIITVIEGNKGEAVARRNIAVNGKYIRGFGVPKYEEEKERVKVVQIELNVLRKGDKGEQVKTLQRLLSALGFKMKNGLKTYGVDGSFGQATLNAVLAFQKANKLTPDGVVGANTWSALLK